MHSHGALVIGHKQPGVSRPEALSRPLACSEARMNCQRPNFPEGRVCPTGQTRTGKNKPELVDTILTSDAPRQGIRSNRARGLPPPKQKYKLNNNGEFPPELAP